MNPDLVKWLSHQSLSSLAFLALGAYVGLAHPGWISVENILLVVFAVGAPLGTVVNFQQAGPLQTWIEAPQQTPGEKS